MTTSIHVEYEESSCKTAYEEAKKKLASVT